MWPCPQHSEWHKEGHAANLLATWGVLSLARSGGVGGELIGLLGESTSKADFLTENPSWLWNCLPYANQNVENQVCLDLTYGYYTEVFTYCYILLITLMMLMANLANPKWCKNLQNDWNSGTWKYSSRAIQCKPTWQGLDGFQRSLHPCVLDVSCLSSRTWKRKIRPSSAEDQYSMYSTMWFMAYTI